MHSVIIPHRDHNIYLKHCLWSLNRSARCCKCGNYEIIVVDDGSEITPEGDIPGLRIISAERQSDLFSKVRLLNIGMDAAKGDVLTFLDADTIVDKAWMLAPDFALLTFTQLCYRVRYLPREYLPKLESSDNPGKLLDDWFADYQNTDFAIAHEGYGTPEAKVPPPKDKPDPKLTFGNSQFTISRENLGDLRWDEEYVGRGMEDLAMIRAIWRKHGDNYCTHIMRKVPYALFQFQHLRPAGWGPEYPNPASTPNVRRYYRT